MYRVVIIMFSFILSIFYFIIVLTIVVFVHEYGHFFIAKKCGVKIDEFSIGMGKKIFGFKDKDDVMWKVCCLPLGGYVKMYGDDNATSFGGYSDNPSKDALKYSLIYKHPLKKTAVAFAGPFMNFVLAFVLFFSVFNFHGKPVSIPVIGKVLKDSCADKAGIKSGDTILSVNGHKINTFNDIRFRLQYSGNELMNIKVSRGGKILNLQTKYDKMGTFGIMSDKVKYSNLSFADALKESFYYTKDVTIKTMQAIWNIVMHQRGMKSIGGPIAIAKECAKAGHNGFWSLLYFIAMISVSLGAINLLPIPMLDGGHVVVNLIEFITRKRFSNFAYKIFVYIGIGCIALLMGIGLINDLFINL